MKNILATAAAAFLLVTSTGCSGFLDEELKSSLSPDNTYTSSYGFEVGVNGLYGWARSEFNTWGGATTSLSVRIISGSNRHCLHRAWRRFIGSFRKLVLYTIHNICHFLLELGIRFDRLCQ